MKRPSTVVSESLERLDNRKTIAARTEQGQQTSHMTPRQIIRCCQSMESPVARQIATAMKSAAHCNQAKLRTLCIPWGVNRRSESHEERTVAELKADLQVKLAKRLALLQQLVRCLTAAPFCHASALSATLEHLQQIPRKQNFLVRVIDYGCCADDAVSDAIAKMLEAANMQVKADLSADEQIDVCGYIASDVVHQLGQAALVKANSWWNAVLSRTSAKKCILKGQRVLEYNQHTLDSRQVNMLVREDCDTDVPEDWWAGAVTLDDFLQAVIYTANEMLAPTDTPQDQRKAWIVNTHAACEPGGHWFTVAIGLPRDLQQEKRRPASATQRRPSTSTIHVQDDQLAALENWATMNMHKPDVAKWELACQDWKALPDSCNRQQYREFCSKHGLPQRDRRDGKAYKNALRQSLIEVANRKRATIDAYFDSPSSK